MATPPARASARSSARWCALLRANRCGGRLLLLIAALVVVIAATAWYQILLNAWNKPFYDSLTRKDFPGFLQQLRVFAELAIVLLALNVGQLWLDQTLKLTLRRGLFGALLAAWMKPGRADGLARSGLIGENPDQRLQTDVDTLADLTGALGIGLFQSTLLLLSFIGVLWDQSGTVSIPLRRARATRFRASWCGARCSMPPPPRGSAGGSAAASSR